MKSPSLGATRRTTLDHDKARSAIEDLSRFFHTEWYTAQAFQGWPGLPDKRGQAPTLEQANEFFLGCCIDYMTKTRIVWENARRFCADIVPAEHRKTMWQWIADHSETDWVRLKGDYRLHRFPQAHVRIHRIANIICSQYDGDVRRVWTDKSSRPLLAILQDDLKIGPALSRMVIGALRDHNLVSLDKSDPKPDVHVCRLMHALGLSSGTSQRVVLTAAQQLFEDPWKADTALYLLGAEYEVKSARQFWSVYDTVKTWERTRSSTQKRIEAVMDGFCEGNQDWDYESCGTSHWAAVEMYKTDGRLKKEMENNLWVWLGVGFNRDIVLWSEVGEYEKYFAPPAVQSVIKHARLEHQESRMIGRESWWRESRLDVRKLSGAGYLELHVSRAAGKLKAVIDQVEVASAA